MRGKVLNCPLSDCNDLVVCRKSRACILFMHRKFLILAIETSWPPRHIGQVLTCDPTTPHLSFTLPNIPAGQSKEDREAWLSLARQSSSKALTPHKTRGLVLLGLVDVDWTQGPC